jgi:hypothetical protein
MSTYPEEKPTLYQTTLPILCALLSSGHYTFNDEETGAPNCYCKDNGKDWGEREEEGLRLYTGRYSTMAVSEAMEIASEFLRALDLEEKWNNKD